MGKIVIKRQVSLDFLGDDYKEAYIVFKAIPVKDYADLMEKMPKEGEADNGKAVTMMVELLEKYFYKGKFPDDNGELVDLEASDMADLDQEAAIKCFQRVVGQDPDPKE